MPRRARREAALRRATPFLRRQLGRALGMRVTPELRFEYDTTPDTARRVDALLGETRHGDDDEATRSRRDRHPAGRQAGGSVVRRASSGC